MKRFCMIVIVLSFCSTAHATLILRGQGTSVHGTYNLIYDSDFDITWYDYTKTSNTWPDRGWPLVPQETWVSGLAVDFGGTVFDDWRLPSTIDGPADFSFDGSTAGGYNNANGEMGHLFYTELGNFGSYDALGRRQPFVGLYNTGDFQNLTNRTYWTGTRFSASPLNAWVFNFDTGIKVIADESSTYRALAVRDGDVTPIPEPSTWLLLGIGLISMIVLRRKILKQWVESL